jgi:hypothetical protein
LKEGEVAQTEVPSPLKMAARSTWPVPTRLRREEGVSGMMTSE